MVAYHRRVLASVHALAAGEWSTTSHMLQTVSTTEQADQTPSSLHSRFVDLLMFEVRVASARINCDSRSETLATTSITPKAVS
jgi:hypothetical protein